MEEKLRTDNKIWALLYMGSDMTRNWLLHDVEAGQGRLCFHVNGSKYAGKVILIANQDERSIAIEVVYTGDDNPAETEVLAQVTYSDMMCAQEDKGVSISREELERFKEEYGFSEQYKNHDSRRIY